MVSEKVSGYLAQSLGLNLSPGNSVMVKACASLGSLCNIFYNRELMYTLTDSEALLPDLVLSQFMRGLPENSSALLH